MTELSGINHFEWIVLNVGGTKFATTRSTLTSREPNSMLATMFDNERESTSRWSSRRDDSGAYLIDRSGLYFEPILNYLRHGKVVIESNLDLSGVLEEAQFYGLHNMADQLQERLDSTPNDKSPLTRAYVTAVLSNSPYSDNTQIRFQGMNFAGCDLSYLDLRRANFKYADLSGANLFKSNLSNSDLERANLTSAVLDGATLWATKFTCANMERASLRNCNFEDPHQQHANLEGANLKHAILDGSILAGVYLRVASLKSATLRNCDLRSAVLAGADLEDCDLTGSDLQEANLRGANFTNAKFDQMRTPLHMSQTMS